MSLDLDVVETPVGPVTVGLLGGRLALLKFGRTPDRTRRLPSARAWLAAWFEGGAPAPPLALEATAFERRVYAAVRGIPRGRVMTYGEVARRAGSPGAARAVGQAMRKNPVCLFIPCHRVVASNGLGGFGGPSQLPIKRRLLAMEGARHP